MAEVNQGYQSLSHSKWDCKYHVVFIPKKRRKVLFQQSSTVLGGDFPCVCSAKRMPDSGSSCDARSCAYVYFHSSQVSRCLGDWFSEGEEAIAVARELCGRERNFTGEYLWARGYAVSTVGFELEQVRQYIRAQEEADGSREPF